jgi:hypothetical protein
VALEVKETASGRFQLRFDGGHQQRYFAERRELLECILRVSTQSPDPRFEVWKQGPPVLLTDGTEAGTRFELAEVVDLSDDGARDRLIEELEALDRERAAP